MATENFRAGPGVRFREEDFIDAVLFDVNVSLKRDLEQLQLTVLKTADREAAKLFTFIVNRVIGRNQSPGEIGGVAFPTFRERTIKRKKRLGFSPNIFFSETGALRSQFQSLRGKLALGKPLISGEDSAGTIGNALGVTALRRGGVEFQGIRGAGVFGSNLKDLGGGKGGLGKTGKLKFTLSPFPKLNDPRFNAAQIEEFLTKDIGILGRIASNLTAQESFNRLIGGRGERPFLAATINHFTTERIPKSIVRALRRFQTTRVSRGTRS